MNLNITVKCFYHKVILLPFFFFYVILCSNTGALVSKELVTPDLWYNIFHFHFYLSVWFNFFFCPALWMSHFGFLVYSYYFILWSWSYNVLFLTLVHCLGFFIVSVINNWEKFPKLREQHSLLYTHVTVVSIANKRVTDPWNI